MLPTHLWHLGLSNSCVKFQKVSFFIVFIMSHYNLSLFRDVFFFLVFFMLIAHQVSKIAQAFDVIGAISLLHVQY